MGANSECKLKTGKLRTISYLLFSIFFLFLLTSCATEQGNLPSENAEEISSAPNAVVSTEDESVSPFDGDLNLYSTEPVFQTGLERTWDQAVVDLGAVVYHDNLFHLFYNGTEYYTMNRGGSYDSAFQASSVGYAVSANGYEWYRMSDTPILVVEGMELPTYNARVSSALIMDDGTWVLYFYSQSNDSFSPPGAILRASAPAPEGPWTLDTKPVLSPGGQGTWDSYALSFPAVVKTDDGFQMYYIGAEGGGFGRGALMMGMATSKDGISWTKHDDPTTAEGSFRESDPISVLDPGQWGFRSFRLLNIWKDPNGWEMLYSISSDYFSPQRIGHARSADGINWQPVGDGPILTEENLNGARALGFADMLYHDGKYYLYFNATKDDATGDIYLTISE